MKNNQITVQPGTTYASNNPCFPGQLFYIISVADGERFGQPNQVIEYERWAWPLSHEHPYRVEITKSWLLNAGEPIVGVQLPADLQVEFNQHREAVLTVQDMMR